jgi:DUF2911 family protein
MNKLYRNILIAAAFLALVALSAAFLMRKKTTQLSPQATVEYIEASVEIKFVYCQPSKKGRLIFGDKADGALQPFGEYWRLGANEATTIETNKDLLIGNHNLAKGIYSVYAVPGKENWKFGFNSVAERWGASEPDYSKDLFTFELPVSYTLDSNEKFTITIDENSIDFWWSTSKVVMPYKVAE